MATIHVDVLTVLNERAVEASARRLESTLESSGKVSGENFQKAFDAELARSHVGADQLGAALKSRLTEHGTTSGTSFADAFHSQVVSRASDTGSEIGSHIKAGILGALGATEIASAVGAIGYTITKGFERLEALDQAKIKLETFGQSGQQVETIMETVGESVKGTAYSIDAAMSVATKAISSGVKPGEDLKKFLKDVEDFAAITGQSLEESGQLFVKVAAGGAEGGQLMARQLLALKNEGVPALRELAEAYGTTEKQMTEMIKSGQVGLPQLEYIIEQHMGGAADKMAHTVGGEIDQIKNNLATLGASFIAALSGDAEDPTKGVADALQKVNDKLTELSAWVSAHREEIHKFFEDAKTAVGELATVLKDVAKFLQNDIPGGITTVVVAFGAWKTIEGVTSLISGLKSISNLLRVTIPADAAASATATESAAGTMTVALGPVAALLATLAATWVTIYSDITNAKQVLSDLPNVPGVPTTPSGTALPARPGTPAAVAQAGGLQGLYNIPKSQGGLGPELPPPGAPGGPPVSQVGSGLGGPQGGPQGWGAPPLLLPGTGGNPKPAEIPYPAEYGQPPAPGETPEHWRQRMEVINTQHEVAVKQAELDQIDKSNTDNQGEIVKANNELIQAKLSETEAEQNLNKAKAATKPEVPYGPGYGAPPRLGETMQQYDAEQHLIEAQHKSAEATAQLDQLQKSGTATTEQLTKANNDLLTARRDEYDAQGRLYEAYNKTNKSLDEIGAKLDKDFGLSKGLPGLAENLFKFLANLAAAPLEGKLAAISAASPIQGGYGAFGMWGAGNLASTGNVLGIPGLEGGGGIPGVGYPGVSAMGPAGLQPGVSTNVPTSRFSHQGLLPNTARLEDIVAAQFPQIQDIGGWRPPDGFNEHSSGRALDLMIPGGAGNKPFGDMLNQWLLQNAQQFGVNYTLWQQKQWNPGGTTSPMEDRGSPTQNHMDHVHVNVSPGATVFSPQTALPSSPQITMPGSTMSVAPGGGTTVTGGGTPGADWNTIAQRESGGNWAITYGQGAPNNPVSGGLQIGASTWADYGGQQYTPLPYQATPQQQVAVGENILRGQGPGAWPNTFAPYTGGPGVTSGQGTPFGGGPQVSPTSFGQGAPGADAGGPTPIGGVTPASGTGHGIGITPGGSLDSAISAAASAFPGVGQAAQTGIKLANRAIQYGGQVVGIGLQGLMETFLPTGGSELANKSWLTKIVGGLAGAAPALPNVAGGGPKGQGGVAPQLVNQAAQGSAHQGTGQPPGPGITVNYTNNQATEDRAGADLTNHLSAMNANPNYQR